MSYARLSNGVPVRTQTGRLATNWASRLGISTRIVLAGLLSLAVMLLAVAPPLFSQESVGTIRGGVFDSTGAAIAGATVTVTDVARGTMRTLTTGAGGEYLAPSELIGVYSVRAEAKGFQTLERTNINLDIGQDVRVDMTLQPGAQTQTITVTSEVPEIDTTSSTLGGAVTNQAINDLPLITRNFLQLLQLRPGVVDIPGSGQGNATVTNGRREGADVLLVEGVTQFDLATSNVLINGANKGGANAELPLDSVQEFNTQQNSPAEYGWRDGSAISVAVKSGTNSIHGSAYAFGRDAAVTDAKQFSAAVGPESIGNLTVEQPGFTLGGPAIKNKLFWFISAEFIRQSSFSTKTQNEPLDLPDVGGGGSKCAGTLKGNANASCAVSIIDACNDVGIAKINPLSAQVAGLITTGPGASCTPQPATATFENLFPANFTLQESTTPYPVTTTPSNNGLAKVDWNPNERNHFSAFVYISKQFVVTQGTVQPYWGTSDIGSTEEYAGAWTYSPSATWINDLRGGVAPNLGNTIADDLNRLSGAPYPGGYSINTGVTNPAYGGALCIAINGVYTSTSGLGQCGKTGQRGPQAQLDFTDKVSHQFGNHAIKFGYEEVFVFFDDSSLANVNGLVSFSSLDDFMNGKVNSVNLLSGNNYDNYRERWHSAFFQDTWRVTRRITLTPGIRWEYIGSPHSIYNHMGTFNPDFPGGVTQVGPGLPVSSEIYPQKDDFNPRMGMAWDLRGNGRTVLRAGIGNLSSFPAILTTAGSAVPYGATLCTGSPCTAANEVVNLFGSPLQGDISQQITTLSTTGWTTACTNQAITSTCNGQPIFPVSAQGPSCTPTAPCSMNFATPHLKNPRSLQWNVDVQRALSNSMTLDVAYVGTYGYNEIQSIDLNEPSLGTGWDATAVTACLKPNLTALGTATAATWATAIPSEAAVCMPDAAAITAARPFNAQFPYYKYIIETKNGFHSLYNGLQVSLVSRPWHGLNFIEGYTLSQGKDDWTKSSQNTTALADPNNENYQYGRGDMNVTHRMRFSASYTIPGIKTPGQMLEGWSLNAIWAVQSGFAWAPDDYKTDDFAGNGEISNNIATPNSGVWQTWNYTGPTSAFSDAGITPIPCYGVLSHCTAYSQAPLAIQEACFNAAVAPYANASQQTQELAIQSLANNACYIQKGGVLTPPAYGTLGNGHRGEFTGPNFQNVDLALEKVWHVKERYSAQLRIECYNLFNHTNFAQFSDGGLASTDPGGDPSAGGGQQGIAGLGYTTTGQGPNRQFQFGLKFMF